VGYLSTESSASMRVGLSICGVLRWPEWLRFQKLQNQVHAALLRPFKR